MDLTALAEMMSCDLKQPVGEAPDLQSLANLPYGPELNAAFAALTKEQQREVRYLRSQNFEMFKRGAETRMAWVDALPGEWRELVHEFGMIKVKRAWREGMDIRKARMYCLGRTLQIAL